MPWKQGYTISDERSLGDSDVRWPDGARCCVAVTVDLSDQSEPTAEGTPSGKVEVMCLLQADPPGTAPAPCAADQLKYPNRILVKASYEWTAPFTFGLPATFPLQATAVATLEP